MITTTLRRRMVAEMLGSGLLVMAVVGSGIAAVRLTDDHALQLLVNSVVTGAALLALITALQPVSAAFNPVVTVAERLWGSITAGETAALIGAQVLGGIGGTVIANLMFDLDGVTWSTTHRSGGGLWLGEGVATFGLVLLIFGSLRSGRTDRVAMTVASYITAAYWFTSSTSFANPAVTVARMFTDTFAGIAPSSAPGFIALQLAGGGLAIATVTWLYPDHGSRSPL